MDNKFFKGLCIGSVCTMIGTLAATTLFQNTNVFKMKDIAKLNSITRLICNNYADDFTESELIDGAFEGIFDKLDDYSKYSSSIDYKKATQNSDYAGIGTTMAKNTYRNAIMVISVIEGSPADKAGLRHGDIITKIAGVDTYTLDLAACTEMVRGKAGTDVELEYIHEDDIKTVTITREEIDYTYVESSEVSDDTGYIKIKSFEQTVADDFKHAYAELSDKKNLIIDLRDNGGGDVQLATDLMSTFLPDGVVATLDKVKGLDDAYKITSGNELKQDLIVLVNENTASASEIMTSYIQENGYGKVVGQKTFGKGIFQGVMELYDGSAVTLTLGKYYTSNGTCINKTGITPDYDMGFTYDQFEDDIALKDDEYIKKAIEVLEG